jgi:hypothetical protein
MKAPHPMVTGLRNVRLFEARHIPANENETQLSSASDHAYAIRLPTRLA